MMDWSEEQHDIKAWLFMRCSTLDEFEFWMSLWDDLTDLVDFIDDMSVESWLRHSYGLGDMSVGYFA